MPHRLLNHEEVAAYIAKGGFCPYCGSEAIEGDSVDISQRIATQDTHCRDCEAEWQDRYTLSHMIQYDHEPDAE